MSPRAECCCLARRAGPREDGLRNPVRRRLLAPPETAPRGPNPEQAAVQLLRAKAPRNLSASKLVRGAGELRSHHACWLSCGVLGGPGCPEPKGWRSVERTPSTAPWQWGRPGARGAVGVERLGRVSLCPTSGVSRCPTSQAAVKSPKPPGTWPCTSAAETDFSPPVSPALDRGQSDPPGLKHFLFSSQDHVPRSLSPLLPEPHALSEQCAARPFGPRALGLWQTARLTVCSHGVFCRRSLPSARPPKPEAVTGPSQ